MSVSTLTIIGGGLAGSEAAWQAAKRGIKVRLFEMRPVKGTPAHHTGLLAELVCSNSLRSADVHNAVGLLKQEMRGLGSLVMEAADITRVPAGSALAVDREAFASYITTKIEAEPNIEVLHEEVTDIPDGPVIIATGPLTSDAMAGTIARLTGSEHLHFYDAIAPILDAESIDMTVAFKASRYGKGGDDYINCPMNREEYDAFYDALMAAEKVPARDFESVKCFEGCMPIEVMAERGRDTLRHGPMKPVGLDDPRTGRWPYAVVQLRMEDKEGTSYNIVGFQTRLKWPEQARVFRMIPGLQNVEFIRYGSLHRNTFICGPLFLDETLQFRQRSGVFMAGQVSGVEGYVESAAMGGLAGINAARLLRGESITPPPDTTAHGALITHLTKTEPARFQPTNVIFSLFPPLEKNLRKKEERREALVARAQAAFDNWRKEING
ncbi:MAG: methylenetetrahydrofolate--tRNA-(uracil(54)-C(5))-methyltransferase (FADH(2)-oxidizing) TrmFO [Nitrospirae bacterium]|nr:methylenetetrahydrofolate--tRNA-(uracil(54)-C(5))-methyltransferase (FADH(2)-oxidizing) TrmFO [Nitrospirota bacterium]